MKIKGTTDLIWDGRVEGEQRAEFSADRAQHQQRERVRRPILAATSVLYYAGIEPGTLTTLALTARRSNHLARSHPLILIVHLVEKLWILSEKFCFKFIPDKGCRIRNDLFRIRLRIRILQKVSDPTRVQIRHRIRIHNTAYWIGWIKTHEL